MTSEAGVAGSEQVAERHHRDLSGVVNHPPLVEAPRVPRQLNIARTDPPSQQWSTEDRHPLNVIPLYSCICGVQRRKLRCGRNPHQVVAGLVARPKAAWARKGGSACSWPFFAESSSRRRAGLGWSKFVGHSYLLLNSFPSLVPVSVGSVAGVEPVGIRQFLEPGASSSEVACQLLRDLDRLH